MPPCALLKVYAEVRREEYFPFDIPLLAKGAGARSSLTCRPEIFGRHGCPGQ
jgi:hypothetical protein